ncbi:MAG: HEPN domain-containing protein [Nanoarchaeota archaeon]|nr:HEPN domain-containing protein [Nanoarchaeota archaeon]
MNLEKLLSDGKIEKTEKTEFDFSRIENDLKAAQDALNSGNFEWAMSIAYNAVLRSGIYLMNFLGYRAVGKEHHKNTFLFLGECDLNKSFVEYFDKVRVRRNNFIYRSEVETSEEEAKEIVEKAKEFVQEIRAFVPKIRTEGDEK